MKLNRKIQLNSKLLIYKIMFYNILRFLGIDNRKASLKILYEFLVIIKELLGFLNRS